MSIEDKIYGLTEAVEKLTAAIQFAAGIQGTSAAVTALAAAAKSEDEPAKRGRGRPRKIETQAPADEFPAEAPAPAPAPAPAKPAAAPEMTRAKVQEALIEVVKKHGRDKCGELCRKHGGPNLSALDPAVWPALVADAQELLAQDAE